MSEEQRATMSVEEAMDIVRSFAARFYRVVQNDMEAEYREELRQALDVFHDYLVNHVFG